ncbi:unnamed protein product [Urochloa humidicola]
MLRCSFYLCSIYVLYFHFLKETFDISFPQVRMKAICVLEAIVRKQDTDPYSIIASYFIENTALSCHRFLLERRPQSIEYATGTTNHSATKAAMPLPVQMPDLIDMGDQDDLGTQSSVHESNVQNNGNSGYVSSVDDLLSGERIADT